MKGLMLGMVIFLIGVPLLAKAPPDACFDPFDWAGEQKAGLKACQKTAGCEVCAADSGAAYGLCFAFCEAMDCTDDEPSASATACLKTKNTYIQLTGKVALPCEEGVGVPAACGSFSACLECIWEGDYSDYCSSCAGSLRLHGCTNVCDPS